MKKVLVLLLLSVSFLFAAMDFQTATKKDLMSIKGIGSKKADAILKYRKSNVIRSADDLRNIKGFGPKLVSNAKQGKTVSKKRLQEKKKISNVDRKKDTKIKNINNSNMTKEQKKAKKKKVRENAKTKKQQIKKDKNNKNE